MASTFSDRIDELRGKIGRGQIELKNTVDQLPDPPFAVIGSARVTPDPIHPAGDGLQVIGIDARPMRTGDPTPTRCRVMAQVIELKPGWHGAPVHLVAEAVGRYRAVKAPHLSVAPAQFASPAPASFAALDVRPEKGDTIRSHWTNRIVGAQVTPQPPPLVVGHAPATRSHRLVATPDCAGRRGDA